MTNKHCYLFALEVKPMNIGDIYQELPSHCTLMHRFWSELSPELLVSKVNDFFKQIHPVVLKPHEHLLLGPKRVPVAELELTNELKELHMRLCEFLNDLGVGYTAPEWVGEGYRAHVTERENTRMEVGSQHISKAVYLVEVEVPGHDHTRFVRQKFKLREP